MNLRAGLGGLGQLCGFIQGVVGALLAAPLLGGVLSLVLLALPPAAHAQGSSSGSSTASKDPAAVRQQREAVRRQLQTLQKNIEQTQTERQRAARALGEVQQALGKTTQRIAVLGQERQKLEAEVARLEAQEAELAQALQHTQERLAAVLRNRHRRLQFSATQSWLTGSTTASDAARQGYWFERVSQAEAALAQQQEDQAETLRDLRLQLESKQDQVQNNLAEQNKAVRSLAEQKEARSLLVADLSSKLKDQQLEKKRLERDEARMSQLINQLVAAIQKAQEEARKRAALAEKQAQQGKRQGKGQAQQGSKQRGFTPAPSTGEFAKLRGRLSLPVQGTVLGQFGKTRAQGGQGPAWKGVLIATPMGQPVRAVASGRVVFAEWLRGFGELIILDHGDEYLSVYGNNGTLFKNAGDAVKAGEPIAETGNSSGNLQPGLYFELRHQGQPFDPISWTKTQ